MARAKRKAADAATFTAVKTNLMMKVPFFAHLLFDRMTVEHGDFSHRGIPTAGTDGKTIWLHAPWFDQLTVGEGVFLMCHEIGHAMFDHMARAKGYKDIGVEGRKFDARLWNVACDYVINDMLKESAIGEMPEGGLWDRKRFPYTMAAEEVYKILFDEQPPGGKGGGGNDTGEGEKQPIDVHVEPEDHTRDPSWAQSIAQAKQVAKAVGQLPAAIEQVVDDLLEEQVDWQEKLKRMMTRVLGHTDRSWHRIHKRRAFTQKLIFPGYTGHGCGIVVVALDTSGSIYSALRVFLSEVAAILSECNPERLILITCDAHVHEWHEPETVEDLVDHDVTYTGGGGTRFEPVFERLEEEQIVPDTVVYLTDLMGSFPPAPHYPVIWCSTEPGMSAPFGEIIHIDEKGG